VKGSRGSVSTVMNHTFSPAAALRSEGTKATLLPRQHEQRLGIKTHSFTREGHWMDCCVATLTRDDNCLFWRFHLIVWFEIIHNNVQLRINTYGGYKMYMGALVVMSK
jgi:hypothetical protein